MLRTLSLLFFSIVLICFTSLDAGAQYRSKKKNVKNRFNAGVVMGLSISQIDGDKFTGFDKFGIRGGLKGSMYLNERLDIVVGLLYNQQGSRFENNTFVRKKTRIIHLDYMEVPALISFKVQKNKEHGYVLETGFSYARLVNHRVDEIILDPELNISYAALAKDFNNNEFNFILGLNYFFNQHLGAGFHYSFQMNKAYQNDEVVDIETETRFLRNYQLAAQLVYNIF